ncbi:MAG: hypothetical protein JWM11_4713 [Planctomycetaceae bacterium]|nr:hypothetical protein [Planctomycetaceae bacterium]
MGEAEALFERYNTKLIILEAGAKHRASAELMESDYLASRFPADLPFTTRNVVFQFGHLDKTDHNLQESAETRFL